MAKETNTIYGIKIGALTILGILAFGGVITGGISLASKGLMGPTISALIFFGSLLIIYFSIKTGIDVYRNWTNAKIDAIVKDKIGFITQWSCPKAEWKVFAKQKLQKDLKGATAAAVLPGVILGGFLAYFGYARSGWFTAGLWGMGGVVIGLTIWFIVRTVAKNRYQSGIKLDGVNIYFAKKSIVVHNNILLFNQAFQSLIGFIIDNEMKPPCFCITIETRSRTTTSHNHYVPIPKGNEKEADKLLEYYQGLVKGSSWTAHSKSEDSSTN